MPHDSAGRLAGLDRPVTARLVARTRAVLPYTLAAFAGVTLIWLVDVATGPDYGFSPFYLIPISLAAWYLGRWPGLLTGLLSALAWISADIISRPATDPLASVWNGLTRAAIFIAFAVLLDQVRRERAALHSVDRHREESLALVAHTLRRAAAEIEAALPDVAAAPGLNAQERAAVLELRRQSRNFSRFAEDVLDVGRLEGGRFRMNLGTIDVVELVPQIAKEMESRRCQLVLQSDPIWVSADVDRLRTAVEHLISNALRFSPPDSSVLVSVSQRSETARITVKDQGVGLSRAQMAVLFRKYGRVASERTKEAVGVGLGLYVVRLIAEAHGGKATVKSAGLGLGSEFALELPLASPPAGAAVAAAS